MQRREGCPSKKYSSPLAPLPHSEKVDSPLRMPRIPVPPGPCCYAPPHAAVPARLLLSGKTPHQTLRAATKAKMRGLQGVNLSIISNVKRAGGDVVCDQQGGRQPSAWQPGRGAAQWRVLFCHVRGCFVALMRRLLRLFVLSARVTRAFGTAAVQHRCVVIALQRCAPDAGVVAAH